MGSSHRIGLRYISLAIRRPIKAGAVFRLDIGKLDVDMLGAPAVFKLDLGKLDIDMLG